MKKIFILASILVVVITAGVIIYFKWRTDFVKNQVPGLVYLKSDSLYKISYSSVSIDEINGEVKIEDLYLRPDTMFKKSTNVNLPRTLLEVYIPLLHLTGLNSEEAMVNEQVIARKLFLDNPIVTLYTNKQSEKKKGEEVFTTRDTYKAILRNLIRIKIDTITIKNARYNMVRWQSGDTLLTGSPVNVSLYDLDISDSTATDTSRVLFAKRALVNIDSLSINNEGKLYSYRMSSVALISEKKELTVKGIFIVPLYGEDGFMRQVGRQADRFDVDFSGARFTNIDVDQALDGNIVADKVVIREGQLKIYRDKNLPRHIVNKVGKFPHQLLMKMPVSVSIKKLDINSGSIEYKEKSKVTGNFGKIRFTNMNLSITNLTNRVIDLRENPVCQVHLRAQFLSAVPVNITLRLYPNHDNGKWAADGTLGGTDAAVFNEVVQPLGPAFIESGILNKCEFHLQGNDYGAGGTVTLLYNDLKVKVLEKDAKDGQFKPKKFASFLANAVLKDDNPKKNKPVRVARINYRRDVNKSFFNLVWKSIFTGIRETIGIELDGAKMDNQ